MHKTRVKKLGYCKECGSAVITTDKIRGSDTYACSACGCSSLIIDLLKEKPIAIYNLDADASSYEIK